MLIVFAPILTILFILCMKVYRWKMFCRNASRPVSFRVFYPQNRIEHTSSDQKRDFMITSNRMSIAAIIMLILSIILLILKIVIVP